MSEMIYLPVDRLYPHPDNPRKDLGDLTELADSIKANGILQNLTVVPGHRAALEEYVKMANAEGMTKEVAKQLYKDDPSVGDVSDGYTVIIGHRRLAAAKLAGVAEVPCVIAELDQKQQIHTMLTENMQRNDLTVYEQAFGFQMMLDLGGTVESVAKDSGFSQKTVRRRLKMAELDPKKLKEVSTRQIALSDFDTLAQIEDIKERNKVLDSIGTAEFNRAVNRALEKQNAKKNMPTVKKWLKGVNAKEIPQSDTWSNKYDTYPGCPHYISIDKLGEGNNILPENHPAPVFYFISEGWLRLYKKHEKAKPQKKSEQEIAREKAIGAAWDALESAANTAYSLRKQFVEKLTVTGKNRVAILTGALTGALLEAICYNGPSRDTASKILGIEDATYSDRYARFAAAVGQLSDKDIPALVYAVFGDSVKETCSGTTYHGQFPEYSPNIKLSLLYNWLGSLGYEMSAEEISLLNGEHDSFRAKAAFEGGEATEK